MEHKPTSNSVQRLFLSAIIMVSLFAALVVVWPPSTFAVQPSDSIKPTLAQTNANLTNTSTAGNHSSNTNTNTNNQNITLVNYASNIEQIKGHIDQALANMQQGNSTLARQHTLHPIQEIYSKIEKPLFTAEPSLNKTLGESLKNLTALTLSSNSTADQFGSESDKTMILLDKSAAAVIPSENLNSSAFGFSVIAKLLNTAAHEYSEAISNGTLKQIIEYQDAIGFLDRASMLFNNTIQKMNKTEHIAETEKLFSDLRIAVNNKDSPASVEAKINKIIVEISGITGIPANMLVAEQDNIKDPLKLISDIRSMLDQVVQEYKAGNYANAENVTITAYLDRFEFVEPAIAMHDIKLMKSLEQMLRIDLREMITGKAPLEQVQQQVDKIKSNLDLAEALITP